MWKMENGQIVTKSINFIWAFIAAVYTLGQLTVPIIYQRDRIYCEKLGSNGPTNQD